MITQDNEVYRTAQGVYATVHILADVARTVPEDEWEALVDRRVADLKEHLLARLREVKEAGMQP